MVKRSLYTVLTNFWQFQLYLWINQMRYIESSIMPFKFQVIAKRNALLQKPNPNTEGSPLQYSLLTGPFPTYYSKSNWPQINVKGHMSPLLYAQSSADGAFPYHSHTLNSSDPILQITPFKSRKKNPIQSQYTLIFHPAY